MLKSFSQGDTYKKAPSVGGSLFEKDFPTAVKLFKLSPWGWNKELALGGNGFYIKGLSNHFDFVASLGVCDTKYKKSSGYFYYHSPENGDDGYAKLLIDAKALVNYKLFTDRFLVSPYVTSGVGISLYNGIYLLPTIPLGGGFQINPTRNTSIYLQTLLDLGLIKTGTQSATKENFNYSIGYSFPISILKKTKKSKASSIAIDTIEKDTDGDAIPDSKDSCPTVKGTAKYHGCPIPDTDGDGINNEEDSCPTVKGITKYHGCPIPDSDGDGINDEEDSCPTVKGIAKYHGCPIPDSDGDGINDEEDSCPHLVGLRSNHGCPDIKLELKEVEKKKSYFGFGKIVITDDAKISLDSVVNVLNKFPDVTVEIRGYTDNIGGIEINKAISQKRAYAVRKYLISKGINADRLEAIGYGKANPIANNKTEEGRAQNRRVELHAKQ